MTVQTIIAPSYIGPYKFRKTIGEGAFSVVKLAINEQTKQFFACKIVPRSSLNSKELEDRFEIEIRINQQIHHRGVVQIIDLLSDEMNYYIFMEFCPSGELFKYIVDRGKLPENEAQIILHQILSTLAFVHSLGIAHRDLKPENLLFDPYGRIKISDFGLSRFVGAGGLVETPCGSPCYASPECLSGEPYDGRKSDLWSLGVILYAMVTGQLPWTKRNQEQLFIQIRSGDYVIPSYLTPECQEMISCLMSVDPLKRVSAQDALKLPWLEQVHPDLNTDQGQQLTMVSLKKVDEFFNQGSKDLNLTGVKPEELGQMASQRPTDYNFIVKEIKNSHRLPSLTQPIRRSQLHPMAPSSVLYNKNQKKPVSRVALDMEKPVSLPKLGKKATAPTKNGISVFI